MAVTVLMSAIVSVTPRVGRIFVVLIVLLRKDWTPEQTAQVLRAVATVIGTQKTLPPDVGGDVGK